jgi:hypothetical protein
MCAELGIRIIPASSPQAKGRIERNHGTQQDRLVKKLRRRGIADLAAANAFLTTEYWADHNGRFARPPASSEDFHVPVPARLDLNRVFHLQESRSVGNDWVVRYHNRLFQLERQSRLPPARSTVLVREDVAGLIEIRYRDRPMQWTEIQAPVVEAPPVVVARPPAATPELGRRKPSGDHPWRHGAEAHAIRLQVTAERRARAAIGA